MKRPECLHIPPLYEGENAQISWETVGSDANYIIERNFNESFTQVLTGYTWGNIDTASETWSKLDQEALSWNEIENRTGKGQTWERLDYEGLGWSQIDNKSQTWQQFESQDMTFEIFRGSGTERVGLEQGCTWLELDELKKDWSSLEGFGHTWETGEQVMLPGLSWDSIEARWLSFEEWEQKGLAFDELDKQQGIEEHRGMTDFIPIGAESAMYRIKAYDSKGEESTYLTTDEQPVIPIFYRSSAMEYPVNAGKRYRFLMKAQDVYGLDRVPMNLRYNQYLLEMTNFAAHGTDNILNAGTYPEEQLRLYSHEPGKVWFQSTRTVDQDAGFSGAITMMEFVATGTGIAAISLS